MSRRALMAAIANTIKRGIRAYHGSPHDFDRFSLAHIGAGEGAQAYGHGLYFAETEAVARSYRNQLAAMTKYQWLDSRDPLAIAGGAKEAYGRPEAIRRLRDAVSADDLDAADREPLREAINLLRRNASLPSTSPGRMYEVNINAAPEEFLDWDAPLKNQSSGVRAGLDRAYSSAGTKNVNDFFESNVHSGADAYQSLGRTIEPGSGSRVGSRVSASALRDAGVPGIRYLDQGSRGAGGGTHNYTVFDDSIIDILRKYGIAGLGVGGGAALMESRRRASQA